MGIKVQIIDASGIFGTIYDSQIEELARHDNEFDALNFAGKHKPEVILLDFNVEKENTKFFVSSLLQETPASRIILVSISLPDEYIINCIFAAIIIYT